MLAAIETLLVSRSSSSTIGAAFMSFTVYPSLKMASVYSTHDSSEAREEDVMLKRRGTSKKETMLAYMPWHCWPPVRVFGFSSVF